MVKRFLSEQLVSMFRIVIMLVLALSFMFSMNVKLALTALLTMPVIIAYSALFHKMIGSRFEECDENEGKLSAIVQENLTGVRVVRAFGKESYEKCMMTAEAKGIILCYEMSRLMGMKQFVVARKSMKPYMQDAISHTVRSITTQKEQTLWLDGCEAEKIRGKRVALIDDVIATGESLKALEELALKAGAIVAARAAILAELQSVDRKDIIYLKKHFVFRPEEDGSFTPIDRL